MRLTLTIVFTLIGLALCLFNATGYDPHNMFLFMLSVPFWLSDVFVDVHQVSIITMYVLTVISYAIIGFLCDYSIARIRTRRES